MASTYTTGFGIEKIGSGEQAGSWGTTTNHNADILDRIASYTAVALSSTTHTLTVREASPGAGTENLQDGMYRVIKFTGALAGNNTVTIAPNTSPAWFIIENATTDSGSSGPYSVILTQGSGANVTVQNGKNAIVYCDGAGSGAVVYNALNDLQVATLEVTGAAAIDGLLTVTGNVTTTGTVEPAGDTSASDNAAIGYTAGEGLVLTGQGSTNDVTIKNDADGEVMGVLTGTTTAAFTGQVTATGFTGTLDGILGSGTAAAASATTITATGLVTAGAKIDLNGTELILDADADTSITADTDDTIDIRIAGADDFQFTANTLSVLSGSTLVVDSGATITNNGTANGFLADNSVTLAKMAHGTDGNIITYDAAGAPAAVATGSSGQVLTSGGAGVAPTFAAAGKWELISSSVFTTSVASVDFTGISGYASYRLVFSLTTTSAGTLYLRVGIDGTFDSGSNYNLGGSSVTQVQLLGGFGGKSYSGVSSITNLTDALSTKIMNNGIFESNDGTSTDDYNIGGAHRTAAAQNCVQIYGGSANLPAGTVALYGIGV